MRARRTWRFAPVVALAATALIGGACGPTVPPSAFRTASNNGSLSANAPGGVLAGPTTGITQTPGSGLGPTGTLPTGSAPTGAVPGLPQAFGPGITNDAIYFGAAYNINQASGNNAIGGGGAGGSDARDAYNVMVDQINKAGGIYGRKLVPVYAGFNATSAQSVDEQEQAACSKWTQDHKVFLILGGQSPLERECAKKAGAVEYWTPSGSNSLPETFQQYPHYTEVTGLNMVRLGSVTIDGLVRKGYFSRGARLGIVAWDDPAYHEAVDRGYVPALRAHGLNIAIPTFYVHAPQNIQDLAGSTADVNSAVLKFSTHQIDHVMLLDGPVGVCGGGCLGLEWMQRAKGQHYYPRYGMNDNNLPVDGYEAGYYPADELKGTISITWLDGDKSADAGWHSNPARDRCEQMMRDHGVDMGSINAKAAAVEACEELWFLQAVVAALRGAPLTPDNFMLGVNAIGTSFQSPSVYGTRLSATQHDGVGSVRTMHFDSGSKKFVYDSDPYRV